MDDITFTEVELESQSPFVLNDLGPKAPRASLKAGYYTPATEDPPFGAVVVSEGLGGVKTARERRYGRFLAQHGFAALVIDSFDARGHAGSPHPLRALRVSESMMLADAFAALQWLADRPEVDHERIGHIGFSYGGMIAILTAYEQMRRHFVDGPARFATHVSYYGPTVPRLEDYRTTGAPVAILNGREDANVDLKRLDLIAQDVSHGGSPVDNRVFDGIYHQWDSDDLERRFDRFNIANLKTTIDLKNTIINEKTGRPVRGFASRTMMIARSVSLAGFHLQRDEETLAVTDALLLEAMEHTGQA